MMTQAYVVWLMIVEGWKGQLMAKTALSGEIKTDEWKSRALLYCVWLAAIYQARSLS
jgi:hypothetical protein